nr:uncharacterized protein LOC111955549 [Salvelinus alpinus]
MPLQMVKRLLLWFVFLPDPAESNGSRTILETPAPSNTDSSSRLHRIFRLEHILPGILLETSPPVCPPKSASVRRTHGFYAVIISVFIWFLSLSLSLSQFLICGMCGVLCARKRTGLIVNDFIFSACCICGLIGGILNFQFVRALSRRPDSLRSLHLAAMTIACLGISSCTLSTWLTCRLASSEQQRMFLEREHSLHHSHEMAEKEPYTHGSFCVSNRRSWTTPATGFPRSPTTATPPLFDNRHTLLP